MGTFTIKLPDVGEGVAEAELVEWHVKVGDVVREDAVLAAVMTDKATVDIPSPVDGTVDWMGGEVGETLGRRIAAGPARGRGRGRHQRARREPGRCGRNEWRPAAMRPRRTRAGECRAQGRRPARATRTGGRRGRRSAGKVGGRLRWRDRRRHLARSAKAGRRSSRRRAGRARGRWPRRPSGAAPWRPASICAGSPAAARRDGSARTISTPISKVAARAVRGQAAARRQFRHRDQGRRPQAAHRREDGARPRAASPTSPMSRRSTSRRSRNCAPR